MKIKNLAAVACLALVVALGSGCSTKAVYNSANPSEKLPITAKFKVGEIKDNSGFIASGEYVDPATAMRAALESELQKAGLAGEEYTLEMTITEYEPGNAFGRWLFPGIAGTYLKTKNILYDKNGKPLANIPAERMVAAGGAFTIDAWREAFNDVAVEIVEVLKREMGILPPKKKTQTESKDDGVSL